MPTRSNRSARAAGTRFERSIADYLRRVLGEPGIDRQVKTGARDRGDIRGVTLRGRPVTVECKDYGGRHRLPEWLDEAEIECGNADGEYPVVIWKRKGVADPAQQYATMTVETLAAMCAGGRDLLFEDREDR